MKDDNNIAHFFVSKIALQSSSATSEIQKMQFQFYATFLLICSSMFPRNIPPFHGC